ncbi:MAG TPA: 3D domain-containing protein [Nannocystaceae bacterium]|nr:3D domain-containing protein [Nannocystaceae bacterium]
MLSIAGLTAALLGCSADDGRGIGSAAGPWQDDDRDTGQPGPLLGSFQMTYYWVTSEGSFTGAKDTSFYTTQCTKIATVPRKFWDALKLEGTGKLADGRMVNYAGSCNCSRSPCFEVLDDDHPWGKGVQQRALAPFRSIAVDPDRIAYGDWVYIEALDGLQMPGDAPWGDFVHDGCMRADDTGSAIVGKHIDFFAAEKAHYQVLVNDIDDHVDVRAAGTRCPVLTDDPGDDEEPDDEDPSGPEVCYPGPDNDGTMCLPLAFPGEPSGYDYPGLLNGNENYRGPIAYLDLSAIPPETKLAPNFTLGELAQASKGRYAVVQPHAVARLQSIRGALGVLKVNSGYRSPGYNAGVDGSATWSRHMYGDGFDYAPQSASIDSGESQCQSKGGTLVEYTTHVHCDWRGTSVDPLFFGAAFGEAPELPLMAMTAVLELSDGRWTAPAEGFDEGEPLRRWTALDADGDVIEQALGESFAPPAGTARIEVGVGAVVTLARDLE